MIIDAMDLLYSNKFDAFALISSDSDFTKLASRLRESQIYVFGVGEKKTPVAFRNACDDFIFTEVLRKIDDNDSNGIINSGKNEDKFEKKTKKQLRQDTRLVNLLRNSIGEYADDDGWALLSNCGSLIKRQQPDFDPRSYGYQTLTKLIQASELFEIDKRPSTDNRVHTVYIKDSRDK